MRRGDITRDGVLKAIQEFEDMGQARFLDDYGFKPATGYLLVYERKHYDSKAIAGVAHRYSHGRALRPDEFSGGTSGAAAWLRRLGFEVRDTRSPNWAWDELVLAAALVAENGWKALPAADPRVVALSDLLQRLPIHPPASRGEKFRNPNGVGRKTADIATHHPDYVGGKTNGGKLDQDVIAAFVAHPTEMAESARLIRAGILSGSLQGMPSLPDDELDEFSAPEGRLLLRRHLVRERDRGLRQRRVQAVLTTEGRLACEVCGFDFAERYGDRGEGYIECHHIIPLHEADEGETKLSDLALVCANCHRMIHRGSPWLTPQALRALISTD